MGEEGCESGRRGEGVKWGRKKGGGGGEEGEGRDEKGE